MRPRIINKWSLHLDLGAFRCNLTNKLNNVWQHPSFPKEDCSCINIPRVSQNISEHLTSIPRVSQTCICISAITSHEYLRVSQSASRVPTSVSERPMSIGSVVLAGSALEVHHRFTSPLSTWQCVYTNPNKHHDSAPTCVLKEACNSLPPLGTFSLKGICKLSAQ